MEVVAGFVPVHRVERDNDEGESILVSPLADDADIRAQIWTVARRYHVDRYAGDDLSLSEGRDGDLEHVSVFVGITRDSNITSVPGSNFLGKQMLGTSKVLIRLLGPTGGKLRYPAISSNAFPY